MEVFVWLFWFLNAKPDLFPNLPLFGLPYVTVSYCLLFRTVVIMHLDDAPVGWLCFLTSIDTDGLISQALLLGNFEGAVDLCMRAERFADAIILAIAGGENLLKETQKRYFAKQKTKLSLVSDSFVCPLSRIWWVISWQMFEYMFKCLGRESNVLLDRHCILSPDSFMMTPRMSVLFSFSFVSLCPSSLCL